MKQIPRILLAVMVSAHFGCWPREALAQQRPLPAFEVTRADGTVVTSRSISTESSWVLIYLVPGGAPSERLVEALERWQSPAMRSRLVLVVDARTPQAQDWVKAAFGDHAKGTWTVYMDARGRAREALGVTGAPTLFGIQADPTAGASVAWTIAGVLNDAKALESPVRAWTER